MENATVELDDRLLAAFMRWAKRTGQSFSSPSDLDRLQFTFLSGWRAYHRAHRGRRRDRNPEHFTTEKTQGSVCDRCKRWFPFPAGTPHDCLVAK